MNNRTFGTAPVFFAAISTILGAIMFLRFGYAVGNVGFMGLLAIILLGHAVTIPTAMAIAEIATNQKVEGGGEYYIISRSFGLTIGGSIGIALFLSQAVSAAFYIIAFTEAFDPLIAWVAETYGWTLPDKRLISVPAMVCLTVVMLRWGAVLGIKLLYTVVGILFVSLAFFFAGQTQTDVSPSFQTLSETIAEPDSFFYVFAICFPAFTGMTAGVGLSGDLKNPRKSIPLGTLAATLFGMAIYIVLGLKLAVSLDPETLSSDQLAMSRIALWGPIIPIGLACATLSSALGSLLVAPRTLQAIGGDGLLPAEGLNKWLAAGTKTRNEPVNSAVVACVIALVFVFMGDVNAVAEIISMFFMVTYGSICLISFLEHFSGDPAYRPTFNSRWYVSLFGALACGWLMFEINAAYAVAALFAMGLIYIVMSRTNPDKSGLAAIFRGVIFQLSRRLQIFLQNAREDGSEVHWRPSIVCISRHTFKRRSAFDMTRWLSHSHGFGTYIHFIEGMLSRSAAEQAEKDLAKLVRKASVSHGRVYMDTLISPSHRTAVCQVVQLPGISGHDNNGILFEVPKDEPQQLEEIFNDLSLIRATGFDIYLLASCDRFFGYKREIHIWIGAPDHDNAGLMILMGYILSGHPEWKGCTIKIFAIYPETQREERENRLRRQIHAGRIPISQHNIQVLEVPEGQSFRKLVCETSHEADLVILGFHPSQVRRKDKGLLDGYDEIGDILFVSSNTQKELATTEELDEAVLPAQADQTERGSVNPGPKES